MSKLTYTVEWYFDFYGDIYGDNEKHFTDVTSAYDTADMVREAAQVLGLADKLHLVLMTEADDD